MQTWPQPDRLKTQMQDRGITYQSIADEARCSWNMVYLVVNSRRKSKRIRAIILGRLKGKAA